MIPIFQKSRVNVKRQSGARKQRFDPAIFEERFSTIERVYA